MTPAQADRLNRVRAENTPCGIRVTARQLPGGVVRITEREQGEEPVVTLMGPDGQYLDR